MNVDVRGVGDVVPLALQEAQQLVLVRVGEVVVEELAAQGSRTVDETRLARLRSVLFEL